MYLFSQLSYFTLPPSSPLNDCLHLKFSRVLTLCTNIIIINTCHSSFKSYSFEYTHSFHVFSKKGPIVRFTFMLMSFLPRYMECRRSLAMRILSVCLSNLITNTNSHTGFRLIPTLMTLNDIIALFCVFQAEFDCFAGQWLKVDL